MRNSDAPKPTSRRLLFAAFAALAVGCLVVTGFAFSQAWVLENRAGLMVENAVNSSRLVSRMDHDVERERFLVEAHIRETRAPEMAALESRIARVEQDLAEAEKTFEPWALTPVERANWEEARADLAAARAATAKTLALSAANRDAEARAELQRTEAQFARAGRAFGELIAINNEEASHTLASIAAIRVRLLLSFLGIGLTLLAHIFFVGRWSMRQVSQREDEMAQHARALEARNRDLDAFAGHVAHDLRGPLAIVALAASRLARAAPQEAATLEPLQRGVRRMEAIIQDLLALARIEMEHGSCNPESVAAQLQAEFAERVQREQGTLHFEVSQAQVACSEGLLRQALSNLVENAAKYRRPEVALEVEVTGAAAEGAYILSVRDNGIGMSREEAGRVFEPFYRAPNVRNLPGTGLGLSIVKRVAEASGGSVHVASQPGAGTTFEIKLPLAPAAEGRARDLPAEPEPAAAAALASSSENPI